MCGIGLCRNKAPVKRKWIIKSHGNGIKRDRLLRNLSPTVIQEFFERAERSSFLMSYGPAEIINLTVLQQGKFFGV